MSPSNRLLCAGWRESYPGQFHLPGAREFGVRAIPGDSTCPVRAMKDYITATRTQLGWDWGAAGFPVFCQFEMRGTNKRLISPVTAAAMASRFQKHLKEFGMDDSETTGVLESLHGLRAGGALYMALQGEDLADIMLAGFWKDPRSARHYIGLLSEVVGDEFGEERAPRYALPKQGGEGKQQGGEN